MTARLLTRRLFAGAPVRATPAGHSACARVRALFRLRPGWLRHLSAALLLIAFSALILQPLAHASPGGHSVHHDTAPATMAQPCAHSHAQGQGEGPVRHCDQDQTATSLLDCCQACLIATMIPESQLPSAQLASDHLICMNPDHFGRTPPGILRPPRLTAVN